MGESSLNDYELFGFPEAALRLQRALERNRRRIAADAGLSAADLRALFRIAASRGVAPKQLAVQLSLTNGAVTGIANRLVASGLIRRMEQPGDRRSIQLDLTVHGTQVMDEIHRNFLSMIGAATNATNESDLSITTAVIAQITDQITAALDAGDDSPADRMNLD